MAFGGISEILDENDFLLITVYKVAFGKGIVL